MMSNEMSKIIQLVHEKLRPEDALEMISTLVADRIRFHNIQMLRQWERNHRFDSTPHDRKMAEINAQKQSVKALIAEAEKAGYHLEVKTNIEVRLVKKPVSNVFNLELSEN
jgi:hypothetical protein